MITARFRSLLQRSLKTEAGFTLIEIMIVVAIIAILGALVVPNFMGSLQESRAKAAGIEINNLQTALLQYNMRYGSYPTTEEGLQKLLDEKIIQSKKDALLDPWGNPYQYRYPGQNDFDTPEIWSYGADGREGGEGNNADIKSWE